MLVFTWAYFLRVAYNYKFMVSWIIPNPMKQQFLTRRYLEGGLAIDRLIRGNVRMTPII